MNKNELDISPEIDFKTARSSGKGGQNVNKVETKVEGRWMIKESELITEEQKQVLLLKLKHRITSDGILLVRMQKERSQLGNKQAVIKVMNELVAQALIPKKIRIASKMPRAVKAKIKEDKRKHSELKANRKKWHWE